MNREITKCGDCGLPTLGVGGAFWHCVKCGKILCVDCRPEHKEIHENLSIRKYIEGKMEAFSEILGILSGMGMEPVQCEDAETCEQKGKCGDVEVAEGFNKAIEMVTEQVKKVKEFYEK